MRKTLLVIGALLIGFVGWTMAANRDSGAYWRARMAIAWLRGEAPESVLRFTDTGGRLIARPAQDARIGVFIAYGQSNSANFGETGYVRRGAVYNFLDGVTYAYEDPALGADGFGGSVWGRVGDRLIDEGRYDAVVFAATGFSSKTIAQLSEGHLYEFFRRQYAGLAEAYGRVDGILFHQGEQNHRDRSEADFRVGFERFRERLQADGINAPLYLSQASYCGNSIDEALLAVQDRIIRSHGNVLRGPNTDLLTDDRFRRDRCHFSAEGLDAFADQWVDAIVAGRED